ncbi:DUF4168 domain-containing protein [Gallaecimonas pentaromativorans]|uniref:DUF4168 domain-containing protein n=1 Tax=Gallaecimonas pentaromativorans TaxID=584787 RepID=UPI003A9546A1
MRKLTLTAMLTASLAALPVASVMAAQQTPAPKAQQQVNVSDAKLEQFVTAQKSITSIRDSAMEKLNKSENPDQAQQIQQQANQDMVEAVKDAGLSVEDYNLIARAVQTDPNMRSRVADIQ